MDKMGVLNALTICFLTFLMCARTQMQEDAEAVASLKEKNNVSDVKICDVCTCDKTIKSIVCHKQPIQVPFTKEQWTGVAELGPTLVDMSNNPLKSMAELFVELPIEVFNLSRCQLEHIDRFAFRELQQMRVLDLSWNNFTKEKLNPHVFEGRYLPERYEPLAELRVLNISHNKLNSLDQDLFEHITDLVELDISHNPIHSIDRETHIAIDSLPMLKILKMRNCELINIPDMFLHTLQYLRHFDLGSNELVVVPQEIAEAKLLQYLDLSDNPIPKILNGSLHYPGFPRVGALLELNMCEMSELVEISDGAFDGLTSLRILRLRDSVKLTRMPYAAMAEKLITLDVEGTKVRTDGSSEQSCSQCADHKGALLIVLICVLLMVPALLTAVLCWRRRYNHNYRAHYKRANVHDFNDY